MSVQGHPCVCTKPLSWVAHGHIQPGLEHFQGWAATACPQQPIKAGGSLWDEIFCLQSCPTAAACALWSSERKHSNEWTFLSFILAKFPRQPWVLEMAPAEQRAAHAHSEPWLLAALSLGLYFQPWTHFEPCCSCFPVLSSTGPRLPWCWALKIPSQDWLRGWAHPEVTAWGAQGSVPSVPIGFSILNTCTYYRDQKKIASY